MQKALHMRSSAPKDEKSTPPSAAHSASVLADNELLSFYSCLNALINYTARTLGLELYGVKPAIDAPSEQERTAASRILDIVWERPYLIGDYVSENPDDLPAYLLNTIAPWRHALRDIFICLEQDWHRITAINADCIFEVASLGTPIETLVGKMPALAILTLLPYKGRLVCDGRVVHLSNKTKLGASNVIDNQIAQASQHPLITTPAELISYTTTLPATHNVITSFCNVLALHPKPIKPLNTQP